MATNYTANYGLCQWEPEDNFLREEFNQDNAKIDAAIKATEEEIAAAEARSTERLATVSHDVYGLMLQNYYDGKTTGWKKALVFDGFQDKSMVAEASASLVFLDKEVGLCRENDAVLGTGYTSQPTSNSGWRGSMTYTATGYGYIYRAHVQTQQASATVREPAIQYRVCVNHEIRFEGTTNLRFENTPCENTLEVDDVLICPGDQVYLSLCITDNTLWLHASLENSTSFGAYFDVTPVNGTSGTITTPALPLPDRTALRAWIRHDRGNFTLTAEGQNGEQHPFEPVGKRTIQKMDGTTCTELELKLVQPPKEGDLSFHLQLELGESGDMLLYDYGILVI